MFGLFNNLVKVKDNGTLLSPNRLSPLYYNAAGDGVANDTAAFTALISKAVADNLKEIVIDDNYTFLVDAYALTFPQNIHIKGSGVIKIATSYTVTTLTGASNTATCNYTKTSGAPQLQVGDVISIKGVTNDNAYNGYFIIQTAGAGTFTYTTVNAITSTPASGVIKLSPEKTLQLSNGVQIYDNLTIDFNNNDGCLLIPSGVVDWDLKNITFKNQYYDGTNGYHISHFRDLEFGCLRICGHSGNIGSIRLDNVHSGVVIDNGKYIHIKEIIGNDVSDIGMTVFSDTTDTHTIGWTKVVIVNEGANFTEVGIAIDTWGGNAVDYEYNYGVNPNSPYGLYGGQTSITNGRACLFVNTTRDSTFNGGVANSCRDVGFDVEGNRGVTITNAQGINCKNGALSTFFGTEDTQFVSCQATVNDDAPFDINYISRIQSNFDYGGSNISFDSCIFADYINDNIIRPLQVGVGKTGVRDVNCTFLNTFIRNEKANDRRETINPTFNLKKYTDIPLYQALSPGQDNGDMQVKGGKFYNSAGQGDYVSVVSIANGGAGYTSVDEGIVLDIAGGTTLNGLISQVRIVTVTAGAVTEVALLKGGAYEDGTALTTPNTPTGSTVGSGLTVNLTITQFGIGLYEIVIFDGGTGYIAGDEDNVEEITGGTKSTTAKVKIKTVVAGAVTEVGIQVLGAEIFHRGEGYQALDVITLSTDSGVAIDSDEAQFTVNTVDADGGITGITLLEGGAYSKIPVSYVRTTGGNGEGAKLVLNTGRYTVKPTNEVSVANATTTGSGLTVDAIWTGQAILVDKERQASRNFKAFTIDNPYIKGFYEAIYMDGDADTGDISEGFIKDVRTDDNISIKYSSAGKAIYNITGNKAFNGKDYKPVYYLGFENGGRQQGYYKYVARTINVPNIPDGSGLEGQILIAGVEFGDIIEMGASLQLQGLQMTPYVLNDDYIRVRLDNHTGVAVDLPIITFDIYAFAGGNG